MQENKPILVLENTEEKVYQKLIWKKNICQCALTYSALLGGGRQGAAKAALCSTEHQ